jgi:peptidoglycan/xylan/chitin deacetylase (PgdA/CDA1 family)/glycosyltransferase involved in cell wall biosynthesis
MTDVKEEASSVAVPPVLSVIVSACGDEDTILRSVASLLQQDFDEPFEVVVATSGGDPTAEKVRRNHPRVRVVESALRLMPGGVRNTGIEAARGEIVAFLEGDCVARPGYVRNLVEAHRAGHGAVATTVAVANPESTAARAHAYLCHCDRLQGALPGRAGSPHSYGLSLTRELLNRVGPFDEALWTTEDTLMARRLAAMGVDAWVEPSVCVEHAGPRRLRELVREQAALGRRQARNELVSTAPGSFRLKLESRAPRLAIGLRTARHGIGRSWFLARNLRRGAPDRRDVIATMPWIGLGVAADMLGWAQEQDAYARSGSFTQLDGAGPTRAPLRRQTTTTGEKTLVLTFDDGPSEYTPGLLRVLSEHDVTATFFVLGERVTAMPELVRAIADAGHDLAIHGWSHTAFTELDAAALSSEVGRTQAMIRALTGSECRDVRPPYGRYDGLAVSWLAGHDLVTWLWTADARDYEPASSVDRIVRNTLLSLTPGGIVLMHDGGGDRSKTVQALPRIIDGARARGFRFVALRDVRVTTRPIGQVRTVPDSAAAEGAT